VVHRDGYDQQVLSVFQGRGLEEELVILRGACYVSCSRHKWSIVNGIGGEWGVIMIAFFSKCPVHCNGGAFEELSLARSGMTQKLRSSHQ
jgi:hypothetical protein